MTYTKLSTIKLGYQNWKIVLQKARDLHGPLLFYVGI